MLLQLVTTLVHAVTATPIHTAPAPVATTVTTAVTSTVTQGFEVLKFKPW